MTDRVVKKYGSDENPVEVGSVFQWYYILARHLTPAGFFAKSHIMFFLLSSFRFLPPLKNDGRGDTFFNGSTFLPVILERSEESRQRLKILNVFSDIPCRILR